MGRWKMDGIFREEKDGEKVLENSGLQQNRTHHLNCEQKRRVESHNEKIATILNKIKLWKTQWSLKDEEEKQIMRTGNEKVREWKKLENLFIWRYGYEGTET